MNLFLFTLDFLAVVFQIGAAFFAYKIYKFNRLSKWWLALIIAFALQALRRAFLVYSDISAIPVSDLFDRSLMFLISLFILLALWAMLRNFENFELVECKVRDAIEKGKIKK